MMGGGVAVADGVGKMGRWSCYSCVNHCHIQGRLTTQSCTTIVSLAIFG